MRTKMNRGDTVVVSIRLRKDLRDKADADARKMDRSLAGQLNAIVRAHYEAAAKGKRRTTEAA